jgi:hypothetical protein
MVTASIPFRKHAVSKGGAECHGTIWPLFDEGSVQHLGASELGTKGAPEIFEELGVRLNLFGPDVRLALDEPTE